MTDTELYSELRNVITDIVNEFVKGGGDPIVARRMAFDAVNQKVLKFMVLKTNRENLL